MTVESQTRWEWCEAMLPRVSRTFALCIRFLPEEVGRSVLISYLLCRVADTVEDASALAPERKRELLHRFSSSLEDPAADLSCFAGLLADRTDPDAQLARHAGLVVDLLREEPPAVREAVVPWIQEMCRGMAEFAAREPRANAGLRSLRDEEELDRYCYYVAGTVGHLLTALFVVQRERITPEAGRRLDALAEDFGAGLQLVNILADVARDGQRGVSYVPESLCRAEGLEVGELLSPEQRPRARRALIRLMRRARQRLRRAREYCLLMPRTEYQLRLFCLIPYYLALRTLRALEQDSRYPEVGQRVKVGRSVVYRTVTAARLCAASNHLLRAYAWRLEEIA